MIRKSIFLLTIFSVLSCSHNDQKDRVNNVEGIQQKIKNKQSVNLNFIGESYFHNSTDSFGETSEQFSFHKNGGGRVFTSWSVGSKIYKNNGELNWEIKGGVIEVRYSYTSSDGITSREEENLIYDATKNVMFSENNSSIVFKHIAKITIHESTPEIIDEAEYNRQQEQAEYESSRAYYESLEEETEVLYRTPIKRNPEPRLDFANVFWKREYTLFDNLTDEPIFPYKKDGELLYKIYCSTNETLTPEYVELTPSQLQNKMAYKFLNLDNCNRWIESKKRRLIKNK